jgi:hypothetical protein
VSVPDFEALIRFLLEPLLETSDALKLDCERLAGGQRLVFRVAFEGEDKGRVFGRGGRNIQAIRKVLKATAELSDCSVRLDVYGEPTHEGGSAERGRPRGQRHRPRHDGPRRPAPERPRRP